MQFWLADLKSCPILQLSTYSYKGQQGKTRNVKVVRYMCNHIYFPTKSCSKRRTLHHIHFKRHIFSHAVFQTWPSRPGLYLALYTVSLKFIWDQHLFVKKWYYAIFCKPLYSLGVKKLIALGLLVFSTSTINWEQTIWTVVHFLHINKVLWWLVNNDLLLAQVRSTSLMKVNSLKWSLWTLNLRSLL